MASPFAIPVASYSASPYASPYAAAWAGAATDVGAEAYDQEEYVGGGLLQNGLQAASFREEARGQPIVSTISQITCNYPQTLQPRPSCNLELTPGDLLVSDELLGRGGWGDVCKGVWEDKDVAIKFIKWNGEPEELRSLQHELTVLARLKHPHILTMYGGSVKPDPEIFLVQELMVGSVSNVMYGRDGKPGRRLGLLEALGIGRDVLRGLVYLHTYVVVHRDIKPDNILLTKEGVAKIGDFGLARFKINTMLQTRTLDMGTAAYMAPEVFDPGLGGVTLAADVYSWALTLWEMLMGERPYKELLKEHAIMWQVVQNRRPPLPEPSAAFPPSVMHLIQRCWAQQPQLRPTAAEALADLEAIIAEGAVFDPDAPRPEVIPGLGVGSLMGCNTLHEDPENERLAVENDTARIAAAAKALLPAVAATTAATAEITPTSSSMAVPEPLTTEVSLGTKSSDAQTPLVETVASGILAMTVADSAPDDVAAMLDVNGPAVQLEEHALGMPKSSLSTSGLVRAAGGRWQ